MSKRIQLLITLAIALVWLINGLYCKLLGMVPRHELIVAAILGDGISYWATKAIGASEILMVIWVVSRIKPAWCALAQIVLVIVMNVIEAALVPDLLLFGYWNMLFAGLFVLFVATDAFLLPKIGKHPFPVEAFFAHSLVLRLAYLK